MDVKPIKTKKANTPEGDRLDVLTTLVEASERAHFLMDLPNPVGPQDATPEGVAVAHSS